MSRIGNLPIRDPERFEQRAADVLTAALRTQYGSQSLNSKQGATLLEARQCNGVFAALGPGEGKTHLSGLLPRIFRARRPLLCVPGSLAKATPDRFDKLRVHWQIPTNINVKSYQILGRDSHAQYLWQYRPDVIVCDEFHFLANVRMCGVARRFARWMYEEPQTIFCALSGSPGDTIVKFAHVMWWCLKSGSPTPEFPEEIQTWADCLDEDDLFAEGRQRQDPRQLEPHIGGPIRDVTEAQIQFGKRMYYTPGVVISRKGFNQVGLEIKPIYTHHEQVVEEAFRDLRELWTCPDGWILEDAKFGVYRVARELALGFCLYHEPRPPKDWAMARRAWFALVKSIIESSDTYDTHLQVFEAVKSGKLPYQEVLDDWLRIEPTFTPNTVCRWLSNKTLEQCAKWGRHGGVIWTHRTEFAKALSKVTGWSYFADEGLDAEGRYIETVRDKTIISSFDANHFGRNMQQWDRGLITSITRSPERNEQLLARLHRQGQKSHTVYYDYLVGCLENARAIEKAVAGAGKIEREQMLPQRLCYGTLIEPSPSELKGFAYQPTAKQSSN